MTFKLFFAGAEEPGWRKLLVEEDVKHLALTYMHLQKRLPQKRWTGFDQLPDDVEVMLDAGAYMANKDPGRMDEDGWVNYDAAYIEFVQEHIGRISMVTEFDSLILGPEYIADMRRQFWDTIPQEKFLPVWHPQYGLAELDRLGQQYERIGIPDSALREVPGIGIRLNGLVQKYGIELHGIAVTKPDILREIHFSSAGSTSWLSPNKYGDTIVWDGARLRRYPKKMKEQARRRHKMAFIRAGYDADKILADDNKEVTRFTIWSWLQLEASLARRQPGRQLRVVRDPEVATTPPDLDEGEDPEMDHGPVDTPPAPVRNTLPAVREERMLMPGLAMERVSALTGEAADDAAVPVLRVGSHSQRVCDTCYIAGKCPQFNPGSECAFDIPIEIRDKTQLTAVLTAMLEMQAQRILFARLNEELEGGYPDPNLGQELDRLMKMTQAAKEIQDDSDFLTVMVKAKAKSGHLSRIFGNMNPTAGGPPTLPEGLDQVATDKLMGGLMDDDVTDAEIVE